MDYPILHIICGQNLIPLIDVIVWHNNKTIFNQLSPLNKYNDVINKLVDYNQELNHINDDHYGGYVNGIGCVGIISRDDIRHNNKPIRYNNTCKQMVHTDD